MQAANRPFRMKHFLDKELLAPNAMRVPVDLDVARDLLGAAQAPESDPDLYVVSPRWSSDIRWVSANSEKTFELFQSVFDRLGIAEHVRPYLDVEQGVRLYAGFLVIRSNCDKPHFHVDWDKTNNEAFTLLTPLTDNGGDFGLAYKRIDLKEAEYRYRPGEAIIFGDHFLHSTKPGCSDAPVVLLCFNFGTDKMVHWDRIFRTAGHQSRLVRQPDGKLIELKPRN